MIRQTVHPTFPFSPKQSPFFYGWTILFVGSIGMLMSIPGQTVGVSVFTDFLIEVLGLTRNAVSIAYLVGTVGSALLLSAGGRAYDRFGARVTGMLVSLLLGGTLVLLSFVDKIAEGASRLAGAAEGQMVPAIAFAVITVGFFALRFLGQGNLTMISRNMVMKWFEKRRGGVNAVLGITIALGFSIAPRVIDELIQGSGWRGAWRLMALVLLVFTGVVYLLYRDNPQEVGLSPDGPREVRERRGLHSELTAARDFTLPEARRTYAFWIFTLTLTLSSLIVTAFTFHVVSIFQESGLDRTQAVIIFLPASLVAVSMQFAGSWSSDYIPLRYIAMVQSFGSVVLGFGLLLLEHSVGTVLVILGMGTVQGMMGVTSTITWPRFFGLSHLGAISGFSMACTVAGSAVGPYLFSLSLDLFGGYSAAAIICILIAVGLLVGSPFVRRPV